MGSGRRLRILTFNRHEPVLYELAKTGHEFHVLLPETRVLWEREWDVKSRPIPANAEIIGGVEHICSLALDRYDLLLAQCWDDFLSVQSSSRPKMLLLMTGPPDQRADTGKSDALARLYQEWQLASVSVAYMYEYYAHSWALPGIVIEQAVDARDYETFEDTGEIEAVLTVAHFFKERDDLMGYSFHRQVVKDDIPYKIVGHNPGMPGSGPARDWSELRSYYRDYRVYLNTCVSGGFIALLEAMTAGMPVITRSGPGPGTPHSLLIDGYNGFVSDDPQYLREKIRLLLAHRDVAKEMGQRAKETVQAKHNIERFIQEWDEAFHNAVSERISRQIGTLPSAFYEGAGVVSDPKASFGKALFSPAELPGEHILYGPFIHLPPGEYQIAFYLRPAERGDFARWAASATRRQLAKIDARWAADNPELAVVDVCSGPQAKLHARQAIHLSDFSPWRSYQGFTLTFHSNGEELLQFRVFATGSLPLYVDPYRTWASIETLGAEA